MYSQNGEDKFVLDLFKGIDRELFFVELGAGDGTHFSNCKLLSLNGWKGISIDADNKGNEEIIKEFITKENIIKFLPKSEIDFLSIDLDGNDYWILEEIFYYKKPKVVCCEVNSQLPLAENVTINYVPERYWDGSYGYGMSYRAAIKLLHNFGYSVVKNFNNTNLIAIHDSGMLMRFLECKGTFSHKIEMPEGSKWIGL